MKTKSILFGSVMGLAAHASPGPTIIAKTFGAGEVRYVDGRAVTTNRRLTRYFHRPPGASHGTEHRRDPSLPVAFPPESQSRAALVRDAHGRVRLKVAETWDHEQGFDAGGYFGEAGLGFNHEVEVEFRRGDWSDYEAGRPVTLRTTLAGARQAAEDVRETVRRSIVAPVRPKSGVSLETESRMIESYCDRQLGGMSVSQDERAELLKTLLELSSRTHQPNAPATTHYKVTGATPKLDIEVHGTKSDLTLRYLNEVLVEALGFDHP